MNDIDFDELDRAVEELMAKRKSGKKDKANSSLAKSMKIEPVAIQPADTPMVINADDAANDAVNDVTDDVAKIIPATDDNNQLIVDEEIKNEPSYKVELKNRDMIAKPLPRKIFDQPDETESSVSAEIESFLQRSRAHQQKSLTESSNPDQAPETVVSVDSDPIKSDSDLVKSDADPIQSDSEPIESNPDPIQSDLDSAAKDRLIDSFNSEELDSQFVDQNDDDENDEDQRVYDLLKSDRPDSILSVDKKPERKLRSLKDNSLNQPRPTEILETPARPTKVVSRGRFMDIVAPELARSSASSIARETADRLSKAKRVAASLNERTAARISDFAPREAVKSEIKATLASELGSDSNKPVQAINTNPVELKNQDWFDDIKKDDQPEPFEQNNKTEKVEKTEKTEKAEMPLKKIDFEPLAETKSDKPAKDVANSTNQSKVEYSDEVELGSGASGSKSDSSQTTSAIDQELDDVLAGQRSPFIPKAKVAKRPLGTPEPYHLESNQAMHIPDRISVSNSKSNEQSALYRAELLKPDKKAKAKASGLGVIILIIVALLISGLLIYFADDISAMLI